MPLITYCPVCGRRATVFEETHEFGSTTVTEFLGVECEYCGRLFRCASCDKWVVERHYDLAAKPAEDHLPYLCLCAEYNQVSEHLLEDRLGSVGR